MFRWEQNACAVSNIFGGFVNWVERFYNCPECGEPIYECDWDVDELDPICPVCGVPQDDDESADLECGFDPYEGAYTYDC